MSRRLIHANLNAESHMARRPGHAEETAPRSVLRAISGFGTLLRTFAGPGDELRTPLPVAPERLPEVPGLPRPELDAGPLSAIPPADIPNPSNLLAWAETPEVSSLRTRRPALESPPPVDLYAAPLHRLVWQLAPPDPAVVARVNHRGFCLGIARELGCVLPGARLLASIEELADHLPSLSPGAWVVKAPLSAAGRHRYIQTEPSPTLEPSSRRTVEKLFQRHGPLLFEPWMNRTDDFGCSALVTPENTRIIGLHRLRVDQQGRFQGLELPTAFEGFDDFESWNGLSPREAEGLTRTVQAVAGGLRGAGYSGPFGIDAWRYRRHDGTEAFHPLGEINARMTFGLLTRALVDRILPHRGPEIPGFAELGLGRASPEFLGHPDVLPLLLPEDPDGTAAWLALKPR